MILQRLLTGGVAAAVLFLVPALSGCDGAPPGPDFPDIGVRVETFTPRASDFSVNANRDIATYERQSQLLTPTVVNDGVVLLYARGDLIFVGATGTWTALPFTQGIEAVGADGVPYVDFTITYTYSFEPGWLFIDVISSAVGVVEEFIPDNIPFRLVTIEPGAFIEGVDHSRFEAVQEAYGLAR